MQKLLEKTREINRLLQKIELYKQGDLPYNLLAHELGDIVDANIYILNLEGELLGFYDRFDVNNNRVQAMLENRQFPKSYLRLVEHLTETKANISVSDDLTIFPVELKDKYKTGLTTIIPIFAAGEHLGTMILGRTKRKFTDSELILSESASAVVGTQMLYQNSKMKEEKTRRQIAVQMAISTLSFSELKAVRAILFEVENLEGIVTASKIADEIGITRSVIVNALRKLESAGIIEGRSLGMKGTYIRIINEGILEELEKQHM